MNRQTALRIARAIECYLMDYHLGFNIDDDDLMADLDWIFTHETQDTENALADFIIHVYEAENEIPESSS